MLPLLLNISTPQGNLQLRGPFAPPAGTIRGLDAGRAGYLMISGCDDITAQYINTSGESQMWAQDAGSGPLLFEDTTYQIWVDGGVHPPFVRQRDPLFLRNITHRPDHRVASGTINLGRQVGRLVFSVVTGPQQISVELEVAPTKLDYKSDYRSLVSDITDVTRGLALAYLRSTYHNAALAAVPATEIEWLTTLRQEVDLLRWALHRINEQPFRHLLREMQPTASHKIRRLDSATRRAVARGRGTGPLDHVIGIGPVRRVINSVRPLSTLDTPEHRWLRLNVGLIHQQLRALARSLSMDMARPRGAQPSDRRLVEHAEVVKLADDMERLLTLAVLRVADSLPQPSPPSLTMLTAPGYRDAYRILTRLRLGLELGDETHQLQSKDLHDIYEIWAYLEVVRIIAEAYGLEETDLSGLVRHYHNGLRIGLMSGAQSDISLAAGPRRLTVSYNRTYSGQTGEQRPDIVIRVEVPNRPDIIIVLDAKYRIDATPEYRSRFGAPGPPSDAINAIHRYRDAITLNRPRTYRPVVLGAALFPLAKEETAQFISRSSLYASLETLGVGALPFLPGNTRAVSEWVRHVLDLTDDELVWNGPPGPNG